MIAGSVLLAVGCAVREAAPTRPSRDVTFGA